MVNEEVMPSSKRAREEAARPVFSTTTICFLFGPRVMELVASGNNENIFQRKSPSPSAEQRPLSETRSTSSPHPSPYPVSTQMPAVLLRKYYPQSHSQTDKMQPERYNITA